MAHETQWDATFLAILVRVLPKLEAEAVVSPDCDLVAFGLDSLTTVELLINLENAFNIELPDGSLSPEIFATPSNLWAEVSRLHSALP